MNYSSLYNVCENGILYFDHDMKEHFVPFSKMDIGRDTEQGLFFNMHIEQMIHKRFTNINGYYHLAAVIEKFLPGSWEWEKQLYSAEIYATGDYIFKAFLKTRGLTKWPKFYDDFTSDNYSAMYERWEKAHPVFKSPEQIKSDVPGKVQRLIYERSKSEFIHLDHHQIDRILNPEMW